MHLVIGTPCYGGQMCTEYTQSLLSLKEACMQYGIKLTCIFLGNDSLIHVDFISFDIRFLSEKPVLVVDCRTAAAPVFLTHGDEEAFYVRVGPGTRKLSTRATLQYLKKKGMKIT